MYQHIAIFWIKIVMLVQVSHVCMYVQTIPGKNSSTFKILLLPTYLHRHIKNVSKCVQLYSLRGTVVSRVARFFLTPYTKTEGGDAPNCH
jgi:hypothetical protein